MCEDACLSDKAGIFFFAIIATAHFFANFATIAHKQHKQTF